MKATTGALFLARCKRPELRGVVAEHRFHPTRKWRFDYAWLPASPQGRKVALEVEGGVWSGGRHTRGTGFVKDMEKYNEAARLGWRVVRVTPSQLPTSYTIQLILDLLALEAS